MESSQDDGGRGRLARKTLTAVLALVAVSSLRKGKRLRGALAAAGAAALGYQATSGSGDLEETLESVTPGESATSAADTDDRSQLRCAACGEPIVPGQSRGPNENDEIVHDDCLEA
ncbi:DUF2892 domain-containing protein [Halostella sp. JP-L12]|uniref:DUF2892 domain-containing protein n=1 Tax=Halostella TaxID=1843185 RepID=UPI000EF8324D|nr:MULTISPECIES: DUF2892 domain-containing protein [Halostella]NHN48280.1 DUF2892 domain-containing protein [Halostella sp. JP-L12]